MSSIFSCAYWPFEYLLWRDVYSSLLPIFESGYLFFCCCLVLGVLHILLILTPYRYMICKYFLPFMGCIFTLLKVSFFWWGVLPNCFIWRNGTKELSRCFGTTYRKGKVNPFTNMHALPWWPGKSLSGYGKLVSALALVIIVSLSVLVKEILFHARFGGPILCRSVLWSPNSLDYTCSFR